MFSSAELIEALRRRMRRSLRPPPPVGEFPPGWREWFAATGTRSRGVVGAAAGDIAAILMAREPQLSTRVLEVLGPWRAYATLWRQGWQPASRDERGTRVAAMTLSMLLHLLFALALVWLMHARFFVFPAPEAAREGEQVIQVEFIGTGTPEDAGGGAAQAISDDAPAPAASASAAPSAATSREPQVVPPPAPLPEPGEALAEAPAVAVVAPAPSPLQVTEVAVPDSVFTVPPPRPVDIAAPTVAPRDVVARVREIDVAEAPLSPVLAEVRTRPIEVAVPRPSPRGVAVVEREIEVASETARIDTLPARELPTITTRQPAAQAPAVRDRGVPMPSARPAAAAPATTVATATAADAPGSARQPATGTVAGATRTPAGGRPDATGSGARATGSAAGAGPAADAKPGTLPSPRRGDDRGDSTRNVAGGQAGSSGLFNADGSARLPGGGRVGGGLPPGTITEDFAKIDRNGTWLKRPPIGYEPTSLDRYWVPHESLLAEWVRKSVTEVRIPIPGSSKSIRCVTVMLALGGACDIVDPNMQDIEATARKPPDVPFKRELQEDQESLGPAP
ncbi:hypothetical protein H5368_03295 [Luteimonas sp. MC1782]|uniref:hypothetical protein n=1 Tax=Luteimonas sp. MC1782 TaxID=2760305 RepID=UPI0015FF472E|nr:hypothetical protein [Luteimonas sp. MC1782]MBB1472051.1 hypothetical protein [Luteimonas sp. MC1782]